MSTQKGHEAVHMAILIEYWPYLVKTAKYLAIFWYRVFQQPLPSYFFLFEFSRLQIIFGIKVKAKKKIRQDKECGPHWFKSVESAYFGECLISNYHKLICAFILLFQQRKIPSMYLHHT